MSISKRTLSDGLKVQFEHALCSGQETSININQHCSSTIAGLLHQFVYQPPHVQTSPTNVRIIYSDGSQGDRLSLRCLPRRKRLPVSEFKDVSPVRVAMISMRHNDLDVLVDMAWFLNREVSQHQDLADVERFCYLQTRQFLHEALCRGPLKLHFYLTGYQPATVGFYRALIDELIERVAQPPVLEVVPFYYADYWKEYMAGQLWH